MLQYSGHDGSHDGLRFGHNIHDFLTGNGSGTRGVDV